MAEYHRHYSDKIGSVKMSDREDGPQGPPERHNWQQYRQHQDFRLNGERLNVVSVFRELGYDLYNSSDISRLGENLRFAEQERKHQELMRSSRLAWLSNSLVALLGAGASGIVMFLVNRWSK